MNSSRESTSSPAEVLAVSLLALVCCVVLVDRAASAAAAKQRYSDLGARACLDCHETEQVVSIFDTAHGKVDDIRTPAATRECQSCHGPSAKHIMYPMQVENVHFGTKSTSAPVDQNLLCLECHETGNRENWRAGAHGFEHVICSTCHSMHDPDKVIPARSTVKATCLSSGCHDGMLAASEPARFTHALGKDLSGKGELTCSGCHNPHGPLESERCLDCHEQTPEALAKESEEAKRFHAVAAAKGTECIRCHKGIAHEIRELDADRGEQALDQSTTR